MSAKPKLTRPQLKKQRPSSIEVTDDQFEEEEDEWEELTEDLLYSAQAIQKLMRQSCISRCANLVRRARWYGVTADGGDWEDQLFGHLEGRERVKVRDAFRGLENVPRLLRTIQEFADLVQRLNAYQHEADADDDDDTDGTFEYQPRSREQWKAAATT